MDTGLYAIVRQTQVVAWPMMAVAVSLVSQHLAVITMGAGAFALACVDFRAVDASNVAKFGTEYRRYQEPVPG